MSWTTGDNHYIRVWCALHVTFKRSLTDVHHFVLDWPIEFLNHQGVRHWKCFMKPLQSLFLLVYWCLDLWSQPYVPPRRDEDHIIIYILMPALLLTACSIAAHIIKDITPTVTLTCLLVLRSSSWIFKKKRDWSQSNLIPPWIVLQLVQLLLLIFNLLISDYTRDRPARHKLQHWPHELLWEVYRRDPYSRLSGHPWRLHLQPK